MSLAGTLGSAHVTLSGEEIRGANNSGVDPHRRRPADGGLLEHHALLEEKEKTRAGSILVGKAGLFPKGSRGGTDGETCAVLQLLSHRTRGACQGKFLASHVLASGLKVNNSFATTMPLLPLKAQKSAAAIKRSLPAPQRQQHPGETSLHLTPNAPPTLGVHACLQCLGRGGQRAWWALSICDLMPRKAGTSSAHGGCHGEGGGVRG